MAEIMVCARRKRLGWAQARTRALGTAHTLVKITAGAAWVMEYARGAYFLARFTIVVARATPRAAQGAQPLAGPTCPPEVGACW